MVPYVLNETMDRRGCGDVGVFNVKFSPNLCCNMHITSTTSYGRTQHESHRLSVYGPTLLLLMRKLRCISLLHVHISRPRKVHAGEDSRLEKEISLLMVVDSSLVSSLDLCISQMRNGFVALSSSLSDWRFSFSMFRVTSHEPPTAWILVIYASSSSVVPMQVMLISGVPPLDEVIHNS